MKTEIKNEDELVFPLLMIDPRSGNIYMIVDYIIGTRRATGTKLVQGCTGVNAHIPVGEYRKWTLNPEGLSPFKGSLTLSN